MIPLRNVTSRRVPLVSLLAVALALLAPSGAGAQNRAFAEINSPPFGVWPGTHAEMGATNPCPDAAVVEFRVLGLAGGAGEVLLNERAQLDRGEAFIREVVPEGVIERIRMQARMRVRCLGKLDRQAVQMAREAARFSIEIVDSGSGETVRATIIGDANLDGR